MMNHMPVNPSPALGGILMVGGIAIAMFIALVGWGSHYFGWADPDGKVQLALITSFILGIIGGFKARGWALLSQLSREKRRPELSEEQSGRNER